MSVPWKSPALKGREEEQSLFWPEAARPFQLCRCSPLFYVSFCCSVPPPSASSKIFKFVIKATVFGLMGYGCYRIGQRTVQFILSMPAAQSYLQKLTEIRSQHWTWVEAQREESGWKGQWRQQRWTGLKEEGNEDSTQRRWVRSKAELLYNKRFDTELTPAMIWWVSLIPGALHETTWFQIEANVTRT